MDFVLSDARDCNGITSYNGHLYLLLCNRNNYGIFELDETNKVLIQIGNITNGIISTSNYLRNEIEFNRDSLPEHLKNNIHFNWECLPPSITTYDDQIRIGSMCSSKRSDFNVIRTNILLTYPTLNKDYIYGHDGDDGANRGDALRLYRIKLLQILCMPIRIFKVKKEVIYRSDKLCRGITSHNDDLYILLETIYKLDNDNFISVDLNVPFVNTNVPLLNYAGWYDHDYEKYIIDKKLSAGCKDTYLTFHKGHFYCNRRKYQYDVRQWCYQICRLKIL